MNEFSKCDQLRLAGKTAADVYAAASRDGVDDIRAIRMLRALFGMSLGEAKEAIGVAEAFIEPQQVVVGATVYWEGADTVDGPWIAQARVEKIEDDCAVVADHRKFLIRPEGLTEVEPHGLLERIRLSYFEKGLASRLQQSAEFWQDLAELGHSGS
ncbi:MAG TPA: hypothetical protein VF278_24595 [Pirellulales bacterium]